MPLTENYAIGKSCRMCDNRAHSQKMCCAVSTTCKQKGQVELVSHRFEQSTSMVYCPGVLSVGFISGVDCKQEQNNNTRETRETNRR